MRTPFPKCPVCGGEVVEKEVEKLLKGGNHTAILKVKADVCLSCGERLYPADTVRQFEDIRHKLEHEEVDSFRLVGKSYLV